VRHYSLAYKLRVLQEHETLDKAGKGVLLRREGLYSSLITEWRRQRDRGARPPTALAATSTLRRSGAGGPRSLPPTGGATAHQARAGPTASGRN